MLKHLEALCMLDGVSGEEDAVRAYILAQLPAGAEAHTDPLGNLLVFCKGKERPKHTLLLGAHMDEVGAMVTAIRSDGSLKLAAVGGVDTAVMLGRQVTMGAKAIPGVIGSRAVHKLSKADREQAPSCDSLSVDIGAASKEEAQQHVTPGDYVHFTSPFTRFGDGYVRCKALDDRAGCAMLLELLAEPLPYDTWFAFHVQEEVGLRGAGAVAYAVAPEYAIVLETTTAADLPDADGEKRVCALGGGAVVPFMDRSTVYDRALYRLAFATAEAAGIPIQTKTMIAGGNDCGAIQRTGAGVRVLAVSAPCRYLHSPSTVAKESDLDACLALTRAMLTQVQQL